ncbi:MAG: hypothetical protein ABSB26_04640 [Nitrososphaerales archaeon]|jgi:hypothetical protein
MKGEAVGLKVGVAKQEPAIAGLIEGILNQLGVEHTSSDLERVPCVVDARDGQKEGPNPAARTGATVYIDDFLPVHETMLALQGRPVASNGFYKEPHLSARSRAFLDSIRQSFFSKGLPLVTKIYWPQDAPGCLVLTHDVDWLSYSPLHKSVVRGRPGSRYVWLLLRYATGRRFGYNVQSMIKTESEFSVKSTFLFRTHYASHAEKLEGAIRQCQGSGCEVALHAAKKSHKSPEAMVLEKSTMERITGSPVSGLREHALKFEYDETWKCIEAAGLQYDMTFGENETTGFRAGLCHPYRPLGADGSTYSLLEIPTSFMDWTAIHVGMDYAKIEALLTRLIGTVTSLNGCLCVNFHNTYVDRDLFPGIESAYRGLISQCKAAGFWVATAKECADWWTRREKAALNAFSEDGALKLDLEDPLILPKVYWPDGRVELLGQLKYAKSHE